MASEGKRVRTEHLELRALASPLPHGRVGFIVPKHRATSVNRNRLKRRLREIARTRLLGALPAVDLVIRARRDAYAATFAELASEVEAGATRLAALLGIPVSTPRVGS